MRPASRVSAAASAMLVATVFALALLTDIDVGVGLWRTTVAVSLFSVAFGLWRLGLCALRPRADASPRIPDAALPRYTVIVPLFREAHMIPSLVSALSASDYPHDKLDIVFACEAVDPDTCAAAKAASIGMFRTVVVPPAVPGGEPQTKPRALNAVLAVSDSELVTIYDAEDRPHPGQLRAAAQAFAAHPDWVALQAPLDYFNTGDGWIARQFGLEYAGLFHVQLPALDRLGLPFPLGGTSNHMRRAELEAVGGWDPYNVTEDADLAFRLAGADRHRRIGWIAPPTQEEACARFRPWFNQRSRWLKGYIQTWLVHMNAPLVGGWRRALMLQLTLGVTLLSVLFYAPVMLSFGLWALANRLGVVEAPLPPIYLGALGFSLLCGMAVGALGAVRADKPELLSSVLSMPLYWLMLFPPLVQAIWELRVRPFHWHKTEHGVTGARPDPVGLVSDQPIPPPWMPTPTSPSP